MWEEFEADVGADSWRDFSFGVVLDFEIVLSGEMITLILGGRGSTLKELKALETLVRVMTRWWGCPTVKSLKAISAGLAMNAFYPLNPFCCLVILSRCSCLAAYAYYNSRGVSYPISNSLYSSYSLYI